LRPQEGKDQYGGNRRDGSFQIRDRASALRRRRLFRIFSDSRQTPWSLFLFPHLARLLAPKLLALNLSSFFPLHRERQKDFLIQRSPKVSAWGGTNVERRNGPPPPSLFPPNTKSVRTDVQLLFRPIYRVPAAFFPISRGGREGEWEMECWPKQETRHRFVKRWS
jgi:hypothetical protein